MPIPVQTSTSKRKHADDETEPSDQNGGKEGLSSLPHESTPVATPKKQKSNSVHTLETPPGNNTAVSQAVTQSPPASRSEHPIDEDHGMSCLPSVVDDVTVRYILSYCCMPSTPIDNATLQSVQTETRHIDTPTGINRSANDDMLNDLSESYRASCYSPAPITEGDADLGCRLGVFHDRPHCMRVESVNRECRKCDGISQPRL